MCKLSLAFLIFVATSTSTVGGELSDAATIVGAGAKPCAEWTSVRSGLDADPNAVLKEAMLTSWLQGFLSGANTAHAASGNGVAYSIPSVELLKVLLDNSCEGEPLLSISSASFRVAKSLKANRPYKYQN